MRYGYYPGCSLHSTGAEFDLSLRKICPPLGIELQEVKGWICCGTTAAHSCSRLLSLALPCENLGLAEQAGFRKVLAPCASCYARLKAAQYETAQDPSLRAEVNELLDHPYGGTVTAVHPLEILSTEEGLRRLGESVRCDLSHLKVACYYGCLLTRPPEVMQFDQHEYPMSMDRVLRAVGIQTVQWDLKTACCGAAFSLTKTEIVYKLTGEILREAKAVGATALAVACPLCHANLDMRQGEIEALEGQRYGLPVFYFSQLIGLAMGMDPKEMAIHKHLVGAEAVLGPSLQGTSPPAGTANLLS